MAIQCTPGTLLDASKCFTCLTPVQMEAVRTYLQAVAAGGSTDPAVLLSEAKCFLCLDPLQQKAIQTNLLCQIANGGSPGACANLEGAGSPLNVVTPDFVGQVYVQAGGTIWQAGSLLSSSWTVICSPGGGGGADVFTYNSGTGTDLASVALTSVTGDFWITGSNITSLSLPNLVSVIGFLDVDTCSAIASLNLDSLQSVGNGLYLQILSTLALFSFPALVTITGDATISGNNGVNQMNFPLLVTVTGNCLAGLNGNLNVVNVPQWLPTNGSTITFADCALDEASVDLILARCVAAGVTTCTIDLSGGSNATPGIQGQLDKTALILAGNAVTTN